MTFLELASKRYSCKKFDGRQIPQEALDQILQAGRLAPTAKNTQEQKIYVVQSEEGLAKVDAVTPCRYNCKTVILVAFDKDPAFVYPGGSKNAGAEDASIVATHMMLAATDAGIDNCWVNFFDPDAVAKEFGLPENEEVVMMLDLGYAAEGTGPLANHESRKELTETVKYL